eukprot:COSAG03_NODE_8266_length_818_cov_3.157163_1_plen_193_part_00
MPAGAHRPRHQPPRPNTVHRRTRKVRRSTRHQWKRKTLMMKKVSHPGSKRAARRGAAAQDTQASHANEGTPCPRRHRTPGPPGQTGCAAARPTGRPGARAGPGRAATPPTGRLNARPTHRREPTGATGAGGDSFAHRDRQGAWRPTLDAPRPRLYRSQNQKAATPPGGRSYITAHAPLPFKPNFNHSSAEVY